MRRPRNQFRAQPWATTEELTNLLPDYSDFHHIPALTSSFKPSNRNVRRSNYTINPYAAPYTPLSMLNKVQKQEPIMPIMYVPPPSESLSRSGRSSSSSSICSTGSGSQGIRDRRTLPAPPKHNVMYHESRYKTEICRQFDEIGECEYGDRCLFAHGLFELKNVPHKHPKFKTERCSAFHDLGFCAFGPRCSFVHETADASEILDNIQKKLPKLPMPIPMPENCYIDSQIGTCDINKENNLYDNFISSQSGSKRLPVFQKLCQIN